MTDDLNPEQSKNTVPIAEPSSVQETKVEEPHVVENKEATVIPEVTCDSVTTEEPVITNVGQSGTEVIVDSPTCIRNPTQEATFVTGDFEPGETPPPGMPEKRGRGRPPKNRDAGPAVPKIKRKRGRPPGRPSAGRPSAVRPESIVKEPDKKDKLMLIKPEQVTKIIGKPDMASGTISFNPSKVFKLLDQQINANDHRSVLRQRLAIVLELVKVAEKDYNDLPSKETAYSYNCITQVMLSLMKEVKADSSDMTERVLEVVIQPLFKELIKIITAESQQARETMFSFIPVEFHAKVANCFKNIVEGVGARSSAEYNKTEDAVKGIFGDIQPVVEEEPVE